MDLIQSGNSFKGKSKDTSGIGVHPEPAEIKGTFSEQKIEFVKQYPTFHYSGKKDEVVINEKVSGHLIYYTGILDTNTSNISGTWKMKVKSYLFGLIPIKFTQVGTWEMAPE